MKYPFMPLFLGDLFADTLHLSTLEFGAYARLFCHAWKHEAKVKTTEAQRISGVDNRHWAKVLAKVAPFFDPPDGLQGRTTEVVHRRVAKELAKAGEISNKRKDAAEQMHAKRRANASSLHMHPHSHSLRDSSNGQSMQSSAMQMHSSNFRDKGPDYRAPPLEKSSNVLEPLPDKQATRREASKTFGETPPHVTTRQELERIYAAQHAQSLDQLIAKSGKRPEDLTPAEIEQLRIKPP